MSMKIQEVEEILTRMKTFQEIYQILVIQTLRFVLQPVAVILFSQLSLKDHAINRTVVNVFIVFCFICCVGILVEAAYTIACYAQGEISVEKLVGDLIVDQIYFVLVWVVVLTCHCYFDAKFCEHSKMC